MITDCTSCDGAGELERMTADRDPINAYSIKCAACGGRGRVDADPLEIAEALISVLAEETTSRQIKARCNEWLEWRS